VVHQGLQVIGRETLLGNDHDRGPTSHADGGEILGRIVLELRVKGRGSAMGAHVAHHDGVAVRRGLGAAGDAGGASGSRHVLDHDLLSQRAGHVLAHDARDHVGRATGREGYDHRDRAGRVGLGLGPRGDDTCERGKNKRYLLHQFPPVDV
jgi:hypothetical protein